LLQSCELLLLLLLIDDDAIFIYVGCCQPYLARPGDSQKAKLQ
tara:strand:+ start:255 stop:383 length:129 start_codon:yes stop_codon:yes gene_type:complete